MKVFESIKSLSKDYPINTICKALGINRSSYVYWLNTDSNNEENNILFYLEIIKIYSDSKGIYGAPKICTLLNRKGIKCSVPKVSRAMNIIGIKSIIIKNFPKKKSRITDKEKLNIINLIKDLNVTHLNQVWTTDITYIHTINEGTFYLITYIDYFSKKVVAWGLFDNQKTEAIIKVLKKCKCQ